MRMCTLATVIIIVNIHDLSDNNDPLQWCCPNSHQRQKKTEFPTYPDEEIDHKEDVEGEVDLLRRTMRPFLAWLDVLAEKQKKNKLWWNDAPFPDHFPVGIHESVYDDTASAK